MNLFIVGKVTSENGKEWEICGVFDSEEKALIECKDYRYCIGEGELNKPFPDETVEWPGAYYPIVRK